MLIISRPINAPMIILWDAKSPIKMIHKIINKAIFKIIIRTLTFLKILTNYNLARIMPSQLL